MIKLANILLEGKSKLSLWGLWQSEDGNFMGRPIIHFKGNLSQKAAEALADKYTGGDYSKYSSFYMLKKIDLKLYT